MTWKTWGGRCIYSSQQAKVYQNPLYRWLRFNSNAIQTMISRRHPETPALAYLHQFIYIARKQPGETCLLGLGGAGVAHALSPYFKQSNIVAVESSQEVINIAHDFFDIDKLQNLTIVHQDANIFIQQCRKQYQHLLVDLYDAYNFPIQCNNQAFFEYCQRLLLPEGVLAVNLVNGKDLRPIFKLISSIFKQATVCLPVKNTANMSILAINSSSILPILTVLSQSRFNKITWDNQWGWVALSSFGTKHT